MFKKATKSRVFQDVVDQVQEAILSGRLRAGDRLPAEREMVDMFQTSRGTLREALRVLENKGLIEIRLGVAGGAVVRAIGTDRVSESLALLIRTQAVPLDELAEFREGVEGNVAALAARRATAEDGAHLRELMAEARAFYEQGVEAWEAFVGVDRRIHSAIARISRNAIYAFVLQSVHDNIPPYYERYLQSSASVLAENYQDLCALTAAIEAGDPAAARRAAQTHVRRFHRYMLAVESPPTTNDPRPEPAPRF